MRRAIIILFLLLSACGKPAAQPVSINDTSEIVREPVSSAQTGAPAEPDLVPVAKTTVAAVSKQTAEQAFDEYTNNQSLNYSFVNSEFLKSEDGVDYYRVKYSHPTGNRYVIVDSDGRIYEQFYKP
jgi:hypothetical protein